MGEFLAGTAFGSVFILMSVLDHRDLIPHGHDREGLFDNSYTFWVLGVGIELWAVGGLALDHEITWLANLTILPGAVVAMYGVYCIIRRPRWMWPAWRREMERRQQAEREDWS